MKRTFWSLLLLAVLVMGYLGIGLVVAAQLSAPSHHPQEITPADVGLNYREVSIRSTDGLELAGWWVPGNDPSQVVVLVPGIEGDKSDWHVLESASVYAEAGYGVLMIDLRAQGGSEGERVTMGYKEVRDVRGALLWLNERGFVSGEVVLHGFSLGGATVLQAGPQSGVAAVVEESAYADLPLILRQQLPKVSGLPSFFTPGVFLMGKLFLGIDPWAVRPEEDARRLCQEGIPLLIIHSTDDETVPFEHARRIKAACPEATLWRIEGYEHVGAYAHPEYRQRILGFLRIEVFAEEIGMRSQPTCSPLALSSSHKRFASGVGRRHVVAKNGYGPGNRPHHLVRPEKADFYAVYAPLPPYDITGIDCHKLSDRLSSIEERGGAWRKRERLVLEPRRCWRG